MSGILNWALEGRIRLYERGRFRDSKEQILLVDEIRRDNNPIVAFIEEMVGFHDDTDISKNRLYEAYKQWCRDSGHAHFSKIKFGKEFFRITKPATLPNERRKGGDRDRIWPRVFVYGINEPEAVQRWDE